MKRFGHDAYPALAKAGSGTLRAAILACGFGPLAAFAQGPTGSRDSADAGLAVSLEFAGLPNSEYGASVIAGQQVSLVATVTGATGAVRYDWDLNRDGVIDRSGTQSRLDAIYLNKFVPDDPSDGGYYDYYYDENVAVFATDAAGAQGMASIPLLVDVPEIGAYSVGRYTQVCGDGDVEKEPGERWRTTLIPYNSGNVAVRGGYALLAPADRWEAALVGDPVVGAFTIDRPAIAVGNLAGYTGAPNPIVTAGPPTDLSIQIARTAPCGSRIVLRSDYGVDSVSSGRYGPRIVDSFYLASGGQCQVYTGCDGSNAAIEPRQGLYYNPQRPGNGISVLLRETAQGTVFFGAWFTGSADRSPTWYIVQGYLAGNQVVAPIYRFTRRPGATFAVDRTQVGNANVVLIDREQLAFAYSLDKADGSEGQRSAELMTHIAPRALATTDATGAYYAASETGWGQVLSEYLGADGADTAFLIHYLYDAQGEPRWVMAVEPSSELASTHPYISFPVHCPGCPWFPDWQSLRADVGSGSFTFDGPGHARVSTQFTLPAAFGGNWQRSALGVELLTDPQ